MLSPVEAFLGFSAESKKGTGLKAARFCDSDTMDSLKALDRAGYGIIYQLQQVVSRKRFGHDRGPQFRGDLSQ
jgi:hypothetical protein